MPHTVITPPTEEDIEAFLPLQRARASCLVYNSLSDDRIKNYRRAALKEACDYARSSILTQTIRATFRTPYTSTKRLGLEYGLVDPDGIQTAFRLPFSPIQSIAAINWLDASGAAAEVLDPATYLLEGGRFIRWNKTFEWPSQYERPISSIVYVAGFPGNPADFEFDVLRVAVEEILIAKWDAKGGSYRMPTSAAMALAPLRTSRTYVPGAT